MAETQIEWTDATWNPTTLREWSIVPLFVINEAVEKIKDGSIVDFRYDAKAGKIEERKY